MCSFGSARHVLYPQNLSLRSDFMNTKQPCKEKQGCALLLNLLTPDALIMPESSIIPKPSKDEKQRRDVDIHIRVTASEKQKIAALAASANADFSEFVRAAALNKKPKPKAEASGNRRALIEALGELGKIGSNINQIARATNRGRSLQEEAIIYALNQVSEMGDLIRGIILNDKQ